MSDVASLAADASLGDDETQLRALLSASSDVIYRMSPDWHEMRQLDGRGFLADARATIRWWDDYIFPEDRPHIEAVIEAAIRAKQVFELEHRVRRADGTPGWTFSRAIPVLDAAGEIADWFGTATDVTARREAEAALRASEERYLSLFETMGQGYCELQLLRDASGRAVDQLYVELNPAYERLIGIPAAVAKGRRASEVMPDLEPWWTETFDRIAATGRPERVEYQVASLDRWFEIYAYPTGEDRLTVLYEDVTDRKRTEEAERKAQERQAFLLRLSDALGLLENPGTVADVACRLLVEALSASRAQYTVMVDDTPGAEVAEVRGEFVLFGGKRPRRVPMNACGEKLMDLIRSGETLVMDDVGTDVRITEDERNLLRDAESPAAITVPRVRNGRLLVTLAIHDRQPRAWTAAEVALVEEVAERTWAAVERARAERALRESEERLRQFGDASQDVLWIRDAATLQWQYLTPAFEAIYGLGRDEALNGDNFRSWLDLVVPEDRDHAAAMIRRAIAGEQVTFEYRIRRPADGRIRWLRNTDFPMADESGAVVMIGGIGHDATELRAAERRFQSLLEGIPQLVWRAVGDGRWRWASPQWTAFTGQAEADSHDLGWLDCVYPDDREEVMRAWSCAMATGGFNVECRLIHADRYNWFSMRATPVRDDADAIVEWLGTSTDIHGLRQLQERQRILVAELQHRVRNIMALIRSVARRTSQEPSTVAEYFEHFEGRIDAMARTQALLTRTPGAGVDLQNLLRDELEAQTAKPQHYSCRGPDVLLSPKAAEVLTLAVHELATNAIKYGALGAPDGFVALEWAREPRDDQDWLCLDWTELRVTLPADPGQRKGFGTELVTRRVPYELKGRGTMEFRPTGLHARIEFPLVPGHSILQTDAGPDDRAPEGAES